MPPSRYSTVLMVDMCAIPYDVTRPLSSSLSVRKMTRKSPPEGGNKERLSCTAIVIYVPDAALKKKIVRHQWNDYTTCYAFSYTNNVQHAVARNSGTTHGEKRYDLRDHTLRFVDREDEMDFEVMEYDSPRALMSCGHAVTPMSLTDWCRRQLDQGSFTFVCGKCDAEWSIKEVKRMALLTPEEDDYFEEMIFENAANNFLEVKRCPGCNSLAMRKDLNNLNVECSECTKRKGWIYRFCWQCMREWEGRAPRSDGCDNSGCQSPLDVLRNCAVLVFKDVKGVHGCPSIRACPTCGMLLEHNKRQCKSIVCKRCNIKFCFVCLSTTLRCLNTPYENCPGGVAPRQTTLPVWKLKK